MLNPETYSNYRNNLARKIWALHSNGKINDARKKLKETKQTIPYQLTKKLHINPNILTIRLEGERRSIRTQGKESYFFEFYKSNEFLADLAPELKGLGGVGLSVGSDQGLDFYNMAGLEELFNIDIDEHTHIVTRSYLEIGARFHKLFGHYPTVEQFTDLFKIINWPITLGMLAVPSSTYRFPKKDLDWLEQYYNNHFVATIYGYLTNKSKFYGKSSWIGNDENLAHTIEGYEKGKIHVCRGDIKGSLLTVIDGRVRKEGKNISLIYLSNAPVKTKETLYAFSQLPITNSTKVIFSGSGSEVIRMPYAGLLSWTMFIFSLKEFNEWPHIDSDASLIKEKIAQGCFRLKKAK